MGRNNISKEEYTRFNYSSPWGYHPKEVEDKIEEYEKVIRLINVKYEEQKQIIATQKGTIQKLQEELRNMHMEMSNLELPEADEITERLILEDFKNYPNNEGVKIQIPAEGIEKTSPSKTLLKFKRNTNEDISNILSESGEDDEETDSFEIVT